MKKALIPGITGQDGSYLAELLLSRGYEVHGLVRRASTFNPSRIDHLITDPHEPGRKLFLYYGDLSDGAQLTNLLYDISPDEMYHLGAQTHVRVSFDMPEYTGNITAIGTTRILEAIRRSGTKRTIFNIVFSIVRSKSKLTEINYILGAAFYCMKHVKEIKRGDLDFFNKQLR